MVRTFKIYDLGLNVTAPRSSFSAKPALMYSKDDFYVLDSGLVVIETTNGIRDENVYKLIKPETVLTWQRLPMCNRIAKTGKEWVTCVDRYQSGTYANQWMVLDYKLFRPGQPIVANTLWVVEQIPNLSRSSDVSATLNNGAWPSYNVPYDAVIYNVSGFYDAWQRFGDQYSYTKCPRAQIFARDAIKVKDVETMKFMMQYNDYQKDPLSKGNPNNAISARSDLVQTGAAFGGIDSKITTKKDSPALRVFAISGPSQQQRVFTWDDPRYVNVTHLGEPTVWNFKWQTYELKPWL